MVLNTDDDGGDNDEDDKGSDHIGYPMFNVGNHNIYILMMKRNSATL